MSYPTRGPCLGALDPGKQLEGGCIASSFYLDYTDDEGSGDIMDQMIYLLAEGVVNLLFVGLFALAGWSVGRAVGAVVASGLLGTFISCGEAYAVLSSDGIAPTQSGAVQVLLLSVIFVGGAFALVWRRHDYVESLYWAPNFKSPLLSLSFACVTAYTFGAIAVGTWFGLLHTNSYGPKILWAAVIFAVIVWLGLVPRQPSSTVIEVGNIVGEEKAAPATIVGSGPSPAPSRPDGWVEAVGSIPGKVDAYAAAANELQSKNMDAAIWARAMVEGGGIEGPVQAAYIRFRVTQMASTKNEREISK